MLSCLLNFPCRFSPVNEVAESGDLPVSPGHSDCTIQPEEKLAENSQETEETISQEPISGEDNQLPSDVDQSLQETSGILEEGEVTVTTEQAELTTGESLNVVDETPREEQACIHCHLPLRSSDLETTHSSQAETKVTSDTEEVEYSKPIPLPKQGISYISTRNYLSEQGLEIGPKPSHEKRTYIIRGVTNSGRAEEEVVNSSGWLPESVKTSNSHIPPSTSHLSYKTVGPILPKSPHDKHSYNMSYYHHPTSFNPVFNRSQERVELQHLNDRFSAYVQTVRRLGEEFGHLDSSSFLHSCSLLEEQIENLKNFYEKELESLRWVY